MKDSAASIGLGEQITLGGAMGREYVVLMLPPRIIPSKIAEL